MFSVARWTDLGNGKHFPAGFLLLITEVCLSSCERQMQTDASKWPSRWWRWTGMRWPESSGSSSKRRWNTRGLSLRPFSPVSSLFLNQSVACWCKRWVMWKIMHEVGGGIFVTSILSLAGCSAESRWDSGSLGENVDEHEITNRCCDNWEVVVEPHKNALNAYFYVLCQISLIGLQYRKKHYSREQDNHQRCVSTRL